MKKIFISTIVILLLFSGSNLMAQDQTLYNMTNLRLSTNLNPARQHKCKVFIGAPALSSTYMNFENTGFTYKSLFTDLGDGTYMPDIEKFYDALSPVNHVNLETQVSIFALGFWISDYQITLDMNNKMYQRFSYPQSFFNIKDGTYYEDGRSLDFSNFGEDFMMYNEIGLGVAKEVLPGLTVGGKIKYLIGISNFTTEKFNMNWTTSTADTSNYAYTFDTEFDFRVSLPTQTPLSPTYDENGLPNGIDGVDEAQSEFDDIQMTYAGISPYIFPKNRGWGLDFGAIYRYKFLEVSASVIDLGYIKWKNNTMQISTEPTQFVFSGVDVAKYLNGIDAFTSMSDQAQRDSIISSFSSDMLDTVISMTQPTFSTDAYRTGLSTKMYFGTTLYPKDWLSFGFLYRGYFYKNKLHSAFTTSANVNFWRGWSYTLAHTIQYKTYNNIGMGLAYKIGPFQWYAVSDNMALPIYALSDTKMANNLIKGTKQMTFHVGFNLTFGCVTRTDYGLLD